MSGPSGVVLGLVLMCAALSARAADRPPPHYALIVAHNGSNDPKVAPLSFADDDGARYFELFAPRTREAVLLTVLDAETQRRHPGLAARTRPPSRRELEAALGRLNARIAADRAAGEEPVLFFVYSGHGQRGAAGEGTISLLGEPFTRTDLFERVLAPTEASFVHLIIDACDSYYLVNTRGLLPTEAGQGQVVARYLDGRSLARFPHVGAVLSTARQRESHEWAAIGAGVFSHQVRSALSGAADVNLDGRVEYSELKAFVAAANLRVEDPRGRLEIFAQPPARDRSAPLADLGGRSEQSFLLVPADVAERLWVEDERGVRVVEFNKERERALVVALPAGRSYFLHSRSAEARFGAGPAGSVTDAASLAWVERGIASRGSLDEAFREHLFQVPFGARFYRGFVSSSHDVPVAPPLSPDLTP